MMKCINNVIKAKYSNFENTSAQRKRAKIKFFGLFFLVAAVCLSLSACEDKDDNNGGSHSGGFLTITHLSEYEGKYVWVSGDYDKDFDIEGYKKVVRGERFLVKISKDEAKVPLFLSAKYNFDKKDAPYKGNKQGQILFLSFYNGETFESESILSYYENVRVDFTGGNATVDWRDRLTYFEVREGRPQGYFTATGLSDYNGQYFGESFKDGDDRRIEGLEKYGWIENLGGSYSYVKISGGQAKIPLAVRLFVPEGENPNWGYYQFLPYTGSDKGVEVSLRIYWDVHGTGGNYLGPQPYVDFTNGNATVDWND